MWNERYLSKEYVYGTNPNDFLVEVAGNLPKGKVLSLAEGEGRNAVFLAELGFDVTAVDFSEVGLNKAEKLAKEKGVKIKTVLADLAEYKIKENYYDVIISIFFHVEKAIRTNVHRRVVEGLKDKGVFLMEAYTPRQLDFKTGGPKDPKLLYEPEEIKEDLRGLRIEHCEERVRKIIEGKLHSGDSAVLRVVATKMEE